MGRKSDEAVAHDTGKESPLFELGQKIGAFIDRRVAGGARRVENRGWKVERRKVEADRRHGAERRVQVYLVEAPSADAAVLDSQRVEKGQGLEDKVRQVIGVVQQSRSVPVPPPSTLRAEHKVTTGILGWGYGDEAEMPEDVKPVVDYLMNGSKTLAIQTLDGDGKIFDLGETIEVSVLIVDGFGRPQVEVPVAFEADGSGPPKTVKTDVDGIARFPWKTDCAGSHRLTALLGEDSDKPPEQRRKVTFTSFGLPKASPTI